MSALQMLAALPATITFTYIFGRLGELVFGVRRG